MKILYCAEYNSDYFTVNRSDLNIHNKYDIHVIGELSYCCEALAKNFWLELLEPENNEEDKSNEPKIVLGFANYSGGYTIIGGTDGITFCPFCGEKIQLEKVGCNTN
jgi:hypothetical protein